MVSLLLCVLLAGLSGRPCDGHVAKNLRGIRAVDFCNFSYPGPTPLPESFEGDSPPEMPGDFILSSGMGRESGQDEGPLITLDEIEYVDVTRDGREDAIVTLTWHSGGTMQLGMVYIWSMKGSTPVLRWGFFAGDRGLGGLHRVYGRGDDLILEIHDPDAAAGNCCSRRIIRTRYHWNGSKFVPRGKPTVLPNPEYKDQDES